MAAGIWQNPPLFGDRTTLCSRRAVAEPGAGLPLRAGVKCSDIKAMPFQPIELIRKLSADLQQRAAEIEAILDVLPVGIAIADDPLCGSTRINRALAQLLGMQSTAHTSLGGQAFGRLPVTASRDGRELTLQERPMYLAATSGREVSGVVVDIVARLPYVPA